jgi:signal transduction histidine kinase
VTDTGRGIKRENQEHLFAAFEQIASATAQPYEGTGLGLYISLKLATLLGAAITFESEFGNGSTFTLELRQ